VAASDGTVERRYDYKPYGEDLNASALPDNPSPNPYKFSGKEWDEALGAYDFSARLYSPLDRRWTAMDSQCEKYYSISPYAYCAGNPVNLIDPDGRVPRIYVNKSGIFGHVFITTGEGPKTTVYTYGRYGALYPVSSGLDFGKYTPTGEGVLLIHNGQRAKEFLEKTYSEGRISIYELKGGDDNLISRHFYELFNNGDRPSNPQKSSYDDPEARFIDKYNLFKNNCVTTTREGAIAGGVEIDSESISPKVLNVDLYIQSLFDENVQRIKDTDRFMRELLEILNCRK
jgi:RHS repeat-associated protein